MDTDLENLDLLRNYVLKLTDQDIYEIDSLILSSAQRARVGSWCEENNIEIPDFSDNTFWKSGLNKQSSNAELKFNYSNESATRNSSIGIDIQSVSEFFPDISQVDKHSTELSSIFTKRELSYAESKSNPIETLAGIFSAKEAIYKSINIDLKDWIEIEVLYESGKPTYKDFTLSISHSKDYVTAVAIAPQDYRKSESVKESPVRNVSDKQNNILNFLYQIFMFIGSLGGIFYILTFLT